jgi:hypothetical protein
LKRTKRLVFAESLVGRDGEKTHCGIETAVARRVTVAVTVVATGRKPTAGLKLGRLAGVGRLAGSRRGENPLRD